MRIVPYEDRLFSGVDALWREAFPDYAPRNQAAQSIPAKLAFQPDLFFVGVEGEDVLGTVMAGYDGHRGWIYSAAVRKDQQGKGLGAALVRHAEEELKALGCLKLNLQVISSNAAVVGFYRRLGYAVEERISMGKLL